MADLTQNLMIRVGAQDNASATLKRVNTAAMDSLKDLQSRASSALGPLSGLASGTALAIGGIGIAAGVAGKAVWDIAQQTAEAADQFDRMSKKTGVSIESLQRLGYAAKMSDIDLETLQNGLRFLNLSIADAGSNNPKAVQSFKELGVAFKDSTGNLRPAEAVMMDVADAISKVDDAAKKTRIMVDLYGRGALALIPMMEGGSAAIKGFGDEAEKMGLIMNKNTIKEAVKLDDATKKLSVTWTALKQQGSMFFIPFLTKVAQGFTAIMTAANEAAKAVRGEFPIEPEQTPLGELIAGMGGEWEGLSTTASQVALDLDTDLQKIAKSVETNSKASGASLTTNFAAGCGSAISSIGGIASNWTTTQTAIETGANGLPEKMKLSFESIAGAATVELEKIAGKPGAKWETVKTALSLDEKDPVMTTLKGNFVTLQTNINTELGKLTPKLPTETEFKTSVDAWGLALQLGLSTLELDFPPMNVPKTATQYIQDQIDNMPLVKELPLEPHLVDEADPSWDKLKADLVSFRVSRIWGDIGDVWGESAGKGIETGIVRMMGNAFGSEFAASNTGEVIAAMGTAAITGGITALITTAGNGIINGVKSLFGIESEEEERYRAMMLAQHNVFVRDLFESTMSDDELKQKYYGPGMSPMNPDQKAAYEAAVARRDAGKESSKGYFTPVTASGGPETIEEKHTRWERGHFNDPAEAFGSEYMAWKAARDNPPAAVVEEPPSTRVTASAIGAKSAVTAGPRTSEIAAKSTWTEEQLQGAAGVVLAFMGDLALNPGKYGPGTWRNLLIPYLESAPQGVSKDTAGAWLWDTLRSQYGMQYAANGMIATKPTLTMMGERGTEAVISNRGLQTIDAINSGDPQGFLGGGRMVYVNFNVNALDPRSLEQYLQTDFGPKIIQYILSESTRGMDVVHQSGVRGAA